MKRSYENKDSGPLRSIYVPPFGLQGQNFTCHILWDKDYILDWVLIQGETGISFEHIYNSKEEDLRLSQGDCAVEIRGVIENGYIGFVLTSEVLVDNFKEIVISIEVRLRRDKEKFETKREFKLQLIRPDLRLVDVPKNVKIKFRKDQLVPSVDSKIEITNNGPGAALLYVLPAKDSKIEFKDVFKEESTHLLSVISDKLESLKIDYPVYSSLLDFMVDILTNLQKFEKGNYEDVEGLKEKLNDFSKDMRKAQASNPDFVDDLNNSISDSIMTVLSATKQFQSWTKSLEGMKSQRITLINPLQAIEVIEKSMEVSLTLVYFDLDIHAYPELNTGNFTIEKTTNEALELPVFELISSRRG